jgi:quinol monooxygenase YgiN
VTSQLNIIARIEPKAQYRELALAAICAIVEQTRAEPGCIEFRVNECEADGTIYLYEEWQDQAAFDAHHAQPYTRSVMEAYAQWLDEEPVIVRLAPII